jgi:hypothetical protein
MFNRRLQPTPTTRSGTTSFGRHFSTGVIKNVAEIRCLLVIKINNNTK